MRTRAIVAMVAGFLLPGAGHFLLGRRGRALAFFGIVAFMFGLGLAIDGSMFTLRESRGELLLRLASIGSMGSGLLYILGVSFGPPGDMTKQMFEYGRTFTLTAGLMNLLLVLDCWDIAMRGKA
jgi:hypothetical protein